MASEKIGVIKAAKICDTYRFLKKLQAKGPGLWSP